MLIITKYFYKKTMKVFYHFALTGFSNTYLIGPDEGGDSILIDPGIMDVELLKLIEDNNFYVKNILITHAHNSHYHGIRTLLKVYNSEIYSASPRIMDYKSNRLKDGDNIELSGFKISILEIPGHSSDSLVFKIKDMLFTGDVLRAGQVGTTTNKYARAILISAIKEKIFTMNEKLLIFPGHGAPSTIKAEKLLNPDIIKDSYKTLY